MTERGDDDGRMTHRSGEARNHWHPDAAERQDYERQVAELDAGGLSEQDRAAQESHLIRQQQGTVSSRMDPHGLGERRPAADPAQFAQQQAAEAGRMRSVLDGPIDTAAEVNHFTGAGQESPEAAVAEGTDGEADRTGGPSISARLSGLDPERDER